MLLIAEIILTIVAWRKGWKWFALIPMGVAFAIGLMIGTIGGSVENLGWVAIFDIFAVIALIILVSVKPKNSETLTEPRVESPK